MKDYLRNSAIICLGWLFFLLLMVIQGSIRETQIFLMLLPIPGAFLFAMAFLFTYFAKQYPQGFSTGWVQLLGLVALDHGIKLIVYLIGVDSINVQIIPNLIYIRPAYNIYGSYLGSLLNLEISNFIYLVLYLITAFFLVEGYRFYLSRNQQTFWTSSFYLSLLAGITASGLDKIIWGKTLDTLYIRPLFICDLKDFYITFSLFFLGVEVIRNWKTMPKTTLKEDWDLLKEFFSFVFQRFQRNELKGNSHR